MSEFMYLDCEDYYVQLDSNPSAKRALGSVLKKINCAGIVAPDEEIHMFTVIMFANGDFHFEGLSSALLNTDFFSTSQMTTKPCFINVEKLTGVCNVKVLRVDSSKEK